MMTSTKASAAAIGGAVAVIARWLLTKIPGWAVAPPEVQSAFQVLLLMGVPYLAVFWAPANKFTKPLLDVMEPTGTWTTTGAVSVPFVQTTTGTKTPTVTLTTTS